MTATAASLEAQAKINLSLRILARETGGYHQLETLFARIDLADSVRVSTDTTRRELVYLPQDSRLTPWRERKPTMCYQIISVNQALGKDVAAETGIQWVRLALTNNQGIPRK